MKILVVGGGGREHALVWKLAQSPKVSKIYAAPGNAGIGQLAQCVDIAVDDVSGLLAFAQTNKIDLTVVGPEAPLMAGLADEFEAAGLKVFGAKKAAAAVEGSKILAKELMAKYNIPTAKYAAFTDAAAAKAYIEELGAPLVVKANGLAAGKGVIVAMDKQTALQAVEDMMQSKVFGEAGNQIVIEEYLEGEEVSILAFTDGYTVVPMESTQDHKRVFDGDQGPNTGGMGAYSPAPVYTPAIAKVVQKSILQPTIDGLRQEGRLYQGVIYAGLMLTASGPKVLEYNARFGDPETQPVLLRLATDLVDIIEAILSGTLQNQKIEWLSQPAVCVVVASDGYPGAYKKGMLIFGLVEAAKIATVFHAGTKQKDQAILTSGGRVLGVTALGDDIQKAIDNAYAATAKISFQGAFYRKDIGHRALVKK